MAFEIERKFLVNNTDFLKGIEGKKYSQGYIPSQGNPGVRVRIAGDKGFLTLKSDVKGTLIRKEFEYQIPIVDAEEMLDIFCTKPLIEKHRYLVEYSGLTWEVDVFEGDNEGLIVAEVELNDENQKIELPKWIKKEVTGDSKYQNSQLVRNPYCNWK